MSVRHLWHPSPFETHLRRVTSNQLVRTIHADLLVVVGVHTRWDLDLYLVVVPPHKLHVVAVGLVDAGTLAVG